MSQKPQPHYDLNYLVVMMTQAMIGLVSPTLLAVAIAIGDSRIKVYFAVRTASDDQQADIEEIMGDFEAFLYPNVPEIEMHILEGYPAGEWAGPEARQVFRVKE